MGRGVCFPPSFNGRFLANQPRKRLRASQSSAAGSRAVMSRVVVRAGTAAFARAPRYELTEKDWILRDRGMSSIGAPQRWPDMAPLGQATLALTHLHRVAYNLYHLKYMRR